MKIEFWILLILSKLLVLYALCYSRIYLVLQYKRYASNDYMKLEVYFIKRLLVYRIQLPAMDSNKGTRFFWITPKNKIGDDHYHKKIKKEFVKKYIKFYSTHPRELGDLLRRAVYYARLYRQVLEKITKALSCEQWSWKTSYGAEDVAITGKVVGIWWTLSALILTYCKRKIVFKTKPIIDIQPIFSHEDFKMDFQCIFSIRLGNVINVMRCIYSVKR